MECICICSGDSEKFTHRCPLSTCECENTESFAFAGYLAPKLKCLFRFTKYVSNELGVWDVTLIGRSFRLSFGYSVSLMLVKSLYLICKKMLKAVFTCSYIGNCCVREI